MKWRGQRESGNVDDRRSVSGGQIAAGGGILGVIIYLVFTFLTGSRLDPNQIVQITQQQQQQQPLSPEEAAADEERAKFVKVVLAETEDVWNKLFAERGMKYTEPTLVLYRGTVSSNCGNASSAAGPFYCGADQKLYIDLSFYEDLQKRFNVPGDFPMAYVVAHEVGHHVQQLLGISDKVNAARSRLSEKEANRLSVKLELQADFLAGVWAHHMQKSKGLLDEGDFEEALTAANAIGDDQLQRQATGTVMPDAFTHGTSEQRMYWFKKGFLTGDLSQADTFADPNLQ